MERVLKPRKYDDIPMSKAEHILTIIVLTLLIILASGRCNRRIIQPIHIADTIRVERDTIILHDTTIIAKPIIKERVAKDTIWVFNTDTFLVAMVNEQKVYADSNYTAWVSGIEPNLDSIEIYNKQQIIKEKVTVITEDKASHIYIGAGALTDSHRVIPTIAMYYNKKKWLIGANIGVLSGKPAYGININYQIK